MDIVFGSFIASLSKHIQVVLILQEEAGNQMLNQHCKSFSSINLFLISPGPQLFLYESILLLQDISLSGSTGTSFGFHFESNLHKM